MEFPIKIIALVVTVILVLLAVFFFFNSNRSTSDITARNIFTEGCVKYCAEISANNNTNYPITKAESLENTDFIKACKQLYPDVKYTWQCWNRNCCQFPIYKPL